MPPQTPDDENATRTMNPARTINAEASDEAVIGPYLLLQRIGEGGMGEVWLAEQKEPVRRRVALKLIKAGMDTRELVARFESERQALALMDHPAIAKVFEAGSTPQGRPYFVMEYVAGIPITAYCDKHKFTTQQRLQLLMLVCEGVQHAHQKAIIHRDLKPSNILVTEVDGKPMPRIIDFGVAKTLSQALTDKTMYTRMGSMIGTPGYLSPEQADSSGVDVDTRTDVYSLGVVLYELLVGARPLDFDKLALDQMLRKLREEDAPRPSTKLRSRDANTAATAQNRGVEPATLIRMVRGDLDAITLKAIEKDRSRRYATPSELASDIGRYLRHEPILARPASLAYRARKYARRHRLGVAIGAAAVFLLIAVSIVQAFQLQRIRRERDRANRITDFMTNMFRVSDPSRPRGNNVTAREILDTASTEIESGLAQDPELQGRMMDVIGSVYASLGIPSKAEALSAKAVERLSNTLGPEQPDTLIAKMHLVEAITPRRPKDAEKSARELLAIQQRVLGPQSSETLRSQTSLAIAIRGQGRYAEAEKLLHETLDVQRRVLGAEHRDTLRTLNRLANVLLEQGRYAEAEQLQQEALAIQRRVLGPDNQDTLTSMANLTISLEREGRYADAEKTAAEVFEINRRVSGSDSEATLSAMNNLAMPLQMLGRFPEAEKLYRETLAIRQRLHGSEHPLTLSSMHNLAGILVQQGKYVDAQKLERQTREIRSRVLGPDHPDTASSTYNLSCIAAHQGRRDEAFALLREAIDHGLAAWADLGIEKDDDLKSLHEDPRFAALVRHAKERAAAQRSR